MNEKEKKRKNTKNKKPSQPTNQPTTLPFLLNQGLQVLASLGPKPGMYTEEQRTVN